MRLGMLKDVFEQIFAIFFLENFGKTKIVCNFAFEKHPRLAKGVFSIG